MIYYNHRSRQLTDNKKGVNTMKNNIKQITEDFIMNRDTIRKAIKLENSYIYPVTANIFCAAGVKADADKLIECKKMIKKN